ncbi:MAG: carbon-nitrogen hydrolase [Chloroflexi bacterium HGW-Chloroflexi-4]|jgi:predicted amidohydrolase|nr:MAG: carbon-nitrogen hydrolase [Chloroflexi bacterium HGW-Chloroflexi-4]
MKKIGLAQMNVEYGNMQKNVAVGKALINSAKEQKCDLVLLPELWSSGFDYHHLDDATENNCLLINYLQEISDISGITICGTFIEKQDSQFFNSFNTFQPKFTRIRYYKNHLFARMHEDDYFTAGEAPIPFKSILGKTGMSICYDLRFPELFLNLRLHETEIFLMSAHWPLSRINHWDVLLQARAIENQAYMIAVNSVGQSGNDIYGGHSTVIAPDGEILFRAPADKEGLFVVDIDPGKVKDLRQYFVIRS